MNAVQQIIATSAIMFMRHAEKNLEQLDRLLGAVAFPDDDTVRVRLRDNAEHLGVTRGIMEDRLNSAILAGMVDEKVGP